MNVTYPDFSFVPITTTITMVITTWQALFPKGEEGAQNQTQPTTDVGARHSLSSEGTVV